MKAGRWSVVEYGEGLPLAKIAATSGLDFLTVQRSLQRAGDRAAHALGMNQSPLLVGSSEMRAVDFAGMLRAGPQIELEIAPKFLGSEYDAWREDFFFLAMLSRHGRLLSAERLRALTSPNSDLATLVARALIQMFWDNHRRPIRTYRMVVEHDFQLTGDVDAEALLLPTEEGFEQTSFLYGRANAFNAAIHGALGKLLLEVRDPETRASMGRIVQLLGKQHQLGTLRQRRLPSRSRPWQSTVDLAVDVLKGFGLSLESGGSYAPGFVLDTWRVWEDLLTLALRAELGGKTVDAQRGLQLGTRTRLVAGSADSSRRVSVTPDLRIDGSSLGVSDLLVDAKYKGRVDQGKQRVSEADVYEAMAFAQASGGVQKVVLVYPSTASSAVEPTGTTRAMERIDIGPLQVWGVEAEVRGISKRGGVQKFAKGVVAELQKLASTVS